MVLQNAGATLADVLKVTVFMTDLDEFDQMEAVYRTYFTSGRMPARSCVEVARLISDAKLEIECVARASESPIRN
jgi:enamine deaminase RidA (YjgF/YER057c/UK114 family)